MYKSLIFLLFTIILGCENDQNNLVWQVTETNKTNPFLENAEFVQITGEMIIFSDSSVSVNYPVIISNNKMLINTETQKWIFALENQQGPVMTLKELYSKHPLIIKLSRIR